MKKDFIIRIDLESQKGIRYGLPKLLKLFKRHNVKGSFYLTMGGESNIFEILRNRGELKTAGKRKIKLWGLKDKIRMALFPIDFIAANKNILRRVIEEGHELGIHGWKHREWTRNLDAVNIKKRLKQIINKYIKYFGKRPSSWTSPGYNVNKKILNDLEDVGITHISDFDKKQNFGKIKNIPINICGENKMPFIEYWAGEGKSDEVIFKIFKGRVRNKNFVSFYLHGMFEGIFKIELLEKMIVYLKKQRHKSKRIIDIV